MKSALFFRGERPKIVALEVRFDDDEKVICKAYIEEEGSHAGEYYVEVYGPKGVYYGYYRGNPWSLAEALRKRGLSKKMVETIVVLLGFVRWWEKEAKQWNYLDLVFKYEKESIMGLSCGPSVPIILYEEEEDE